MAFENIDFKNGGYVAAVAALHEGANFSLTLPNLEDWTQHKADDDLSNLGCFYKIYIDNFLELMKKVSRYH